jgi:hypothetical protein
MILARIFGLRDAKKVTDSQKKLLRMNFSAHLLNNDHTHRSLAYRFVCSYANMVMLGTVVIRISR